ncbi:hypothetical protein K501DRAFT_181871 [Backusella circina FSU 941]|nr:hypothetical protein K501DRAFT_181871 [Backusella circina FSU 941]
MLQDISTPGFRSSEVLAALKTSLDELSRDAKDKLITQVNSIFEFYVMTNEGKTETFTINLKRGSNNDITKGKGVENPSAIISIRDVDLVDLANRKYHGKNKYYLAILLLI